MASALQQALLMSNDPSHVAPDPYWANVVFLGLANVVGIYDAKGHTITQPGAGSGGIISSLAQSKFGNYVIYQPGAVTELDCTTTDFNGLLAGDYTIEYWFYPTVIDFTQRMTLCLQTTGVFFSLYASSVQIYSSIGSNINFNSGQYTLNAWNFFAVSCTSGTARFYRNGALIYGIANVNGTTGTLKLLNDSNTGYFAPATGYMDQVRVTKGVGRYPSTCPVPTAAFPQY